VFEASVKDKLQLSFAQQKNDPDIGVFKPGIVDELEPSVQF
jgi:hypothetical protein